MWISTSSSQRSSAVAVSPKRFFRRRSLSSTLTANICLVTTFSASSTVPNEPEPSLRTFSKSEWTTTRPPLLPLPCTGVPSVDEPGWSSNEVRLCAVSGARVSVSLSPPFVSNVTR